MGGVIYSSDFWLSKVARMERSGIRGNETRIPLLLHAGYMFNQSRNNTETYGNLKYLFRVHPWLPPHPQTPKHSTNSSPPGCIPKI
jgi:hypothetical protein